MGALTPWLYAARHRLADRATQPLNRDQRQKKPCGDEKPKPYRLGTMGCNGSDDK